MELEDSGKKILEILVTHLIKVVPGKPETYEQYKTVHERLKLPYLGPTWGESLTKQGLANLADWTYENDLPGITGIIVNSGSFEPGKGYFKLFGKKDIDYIWWEGEVKKSKEYDWSIYLDAQFFLEPIDIECPNRQDITVSRIIRDTASSQKVKSLHKFSCQICGIAIDLPNNKKYAEAHHIQPLGKPHNGPDIIENMICVCPNHHAMLDYGALKLEKNHINITTGHTIDNQYIDYHNKTVYKR